MRLFIAALFRLKSDFLGDKPGFIFNITFPLVIGLVVQFIWNAELSADYVALGYVAWEFYARLLLEGGRFYRNMGLVVDGCYSYIEIFCLTYISIFLKSLMSLLIIYSVFEFPGAFNLLLILLFLFGVGFVVFIFSMSVSLYLKALKVLFIFYARIGLWISPIFWETKSKIVFLNPAAFIIEMVRMGKNFSFISDLRILVVIAAVGMAILVSRLLSFHEIRRKLTVDYFRML